MNTGGEQQRAYRCSIRDFETYKLLGASHGSRTRRGGCINGWSWIWCCYGRSHQVSGTWIWRHVCHGYIIILPHLVSVHCRFRCANHTVVFIPFTAIRCVFTWVSVYLPIFLRNSKILASLQHEYSRSYPAHLITVLDSWTLDVTEISTLVRVKTLTRLFFLRKHLTIKTGEWGRFIRLLFLDARHCCGLETGWCARGAVVSSRWFEKFLLFTGRTSCVSWCLRGPLRCDKRVHWSSFAQVLEYRKWWRVAALF